MGAMSSQRYGQKTQSESRQSDSAERERKQYDGNRNWSNPGPQAKECRHLEKAKKHIVL